jgi:uncharacterized membrane protein YphA (DoxX/SURF4 family)
MLESAPFHFRRVIIWLGRIVIAGFFIYAGLAKLIRWDIHLPPLTVANFPFPWRESIPTSLFAAQVDSYQMVAPWVSLAIAHWLPWAEILLGVLLLIGWHLRVSSTIVTLIIGGFFAAVLRAYALHLDINCGCFAKPEPLTGMTVLRDGALFLLAVLMTVFAFQQAREPHPWSASAEPST